MAGVVYMALCSASNAAYANEDMGKTDAWKISAGPGVYVFPAFPGSSRLKVFPLPVQDISWHDRVFSQGPDVFGVNVLRAENYHAGASISFDFQSRTSSDDARLKGLSDIHYGPKLRLFADNTWWAFTGATAVYQDIAGTGQGLTAMADLFISAPLGRLMLSVGPGVTWASGQYARTFFAITPSQSAASGLPQYAAGSGLRDVHLNMAATYVISSNWSASAAVIAGRLEGSAAGSPVTKRRLDLNGTMSVAYKF